MCIIHVKAELVPGAADLTLSLPLVTEPSLGGASPQVSGVMCEEVEI